MAEGERFVDNGDGTVTDTKYKMMWLKEDYYQRKGKWCSWAGANKYVKLMNEKQFAGYTDWRLPKSQDCRNLYDHESKNYDFNDDIVHIDYIFPEGCGFTYWCQEESGHNAMAYNFYSDRGYQIRKTAKEDSFMSCRPCRPTGKAKVAKRVSTTGRTRRE
ncbi:Lcl C-terminal domain-containing protein [Nitrospina gracilis]|uniref:Lcl C-terminal domain-containing protein n=1 Tax=Nitrospina gracilis TaxID=35801 RepID=UPI001F2FDCAF|nr:hypothetical protein [Nitrospina gracilis Nb-211]